MVRPLSPAASGQPASVELSGPPSSAPRARTRARVAVALHKFHRGFRGDELEEVRAGYRVRPLRAALETHYRSDAHLVTYLVEGARWQPRLTKVGLPVFPGEVLVESFFCDIDNPDHARWTPALERAALGQLDRLEVLQTAGVYHTRSGRRVVQPLAAPLPVHRVERALSRWLASLELAGLEVDWACRDWTRHFRLPHVVRDGQTVRAPVLWLERMAPVSMELPDGPPSLPYPPPPRASAVRVAAPPGPRYGAPREAPSFEWTTTLDPSWMPAIERVAHAVRQVETEWHSLFLAITGALLARGAEPEDLPLLCRAISMQTGADDRPDDRELIGRSTAERAVRGQPVVGLSTLRRRWPSVAAAFGQSAPMRLRELTALLQAVGGLRALALQSGIDPSAIRASLGGAPLRDADRATLRRLAEARLADPR